MGEKTKRITVLSLLATIALILSYIESLLPPIMPSVPGIKIGLPNIIIILILYKASFASAAVVSLVRLIIVTLLFGNAQTFVYSLAGAVLSLGVMWLFKKTDLFSYIGVSVLGGISHNLGQIAVAMLLLETKEIIYYMPVLAISGTVAGIFVGLLSGYVINRLKTVKI